MEPKNTCWYISAKIPGGTIIDGLIEANDPTTAMDIFIESESWQLENDEKFTFLKIINFYETENKE